MFKQLTLKNWKSFRQADLYIDPLTVLIGTNASGKSNVVDALDFLNRISQGITLETALVGDSNIPGIRGGSEWAARQSETEFTLEVIIASSAEDQEYLYRITVDTSAMSIVESSLTYIYSKNKVLEISNKLNKTILPSLSNMPPGLQSIDFYGFDENLNLSESDLNKFDAFLSTYFSLKKIFIVNPIPELMRSYSPLSKNLERDGSNIAGVLAALPEPEKQQIETTLLTYLTQLPEGDLQRVWAEPVGRLGSDAMLYCEEKWVKNQSPALIDARGMSDGTLRFLAILTAMLTRPEGSLIVIEEVDNGLHPSRAGLLLKMLREIGEQRKIDVLVTTHNPALLDELTPDYIPFVIVAYRDRETGESQLIPLEEIEDLPKLMSFGSLGEVAQAGLIEKSLGAKPE